MVAHSTATMMSALSPTGSLLAIADGKQQQQLRVSIRHAATGVLQCTLQTNRSTGLQVGDAGAAAVVGSVLNNSKLLWLNETHVAVLNVSSNNTIVVFDVTRGVVAYTVESSSGSPSKRKHRHHDDASSLLSFADIAADNNNSNDDCFYVACRNPESSKVVIHEYSTSTGKLQRKIKAGKCGTTSPDTTNPCRLAVSRSYAVVHCTAGEDSSIRVLDIDTGSKVSKVKIAHRQSSHSTAASATTILAAAGDVGCTVDGTSGNLVLFQLSTGKVFRCDTAVSVGEGATVQLMSSARQDENDEDDSTFWLLIANKKLIRFGITHDNTTCTIEKTCQIQSSEDVSVQLLLSVNHLVAVSSSGSDVRVRMVELNTSTMPETVTISWEDTEKEDTETTAASSSKKRKQTTVLGPGQAGGEARGVTEGVDSSKRGKVIEDDDDEADEEEDDGPTIAERLAQLQQALDAEDSEDDDNRMATDDDDVGNNTDKFVPKQATTESLTQLLSQALQSVDNSMLEQALQVRDANILKETCRMLSADYLAALLAALTTRLASKPARAEHLVQWIAAVLQSNQIAETEHLLPLQNLLQERLEVFPMLLQLEGRLERMANM
jgi:Dip2/Utp12 Family